MRLVLLAIIPLLAACRAAPPATTTCATPATIRDLRGLDGCGLVLELADGKRLEPHGVLWQEFTKVAGARVTVSYAPLPGSMSVCMAGQAVTLRCIRPAR